jgi:hypothetical protein
MNSFVKAESWLAARSNWHSLRLELAVRTGAPKPDITSFEGFKQAVLRARSVNFVSTTAVYMNQKLFPSLGIADAVARKANEDTLADLPGTKVDLVLRHYDGPLVVCPFASLHWLSTGSAPWYVVSSTVGWALGLFLIAHH